MFSSLLFYTAVVVGFDRHLYTVDELDGQVEVCVNITVPRRQDIGTVTFNLTVETQDGSAGIYMYISIKSESITLVCLLNLYVLLSRWYILQSLMMTT